MNLSKDIAARLLKESDEDLEKKIMNKKELELKTIEEMDAELEAIKEERAYLTRKERVAKAIMAYFKLISIPTITSICFLVLILTKQEESITILEAFKAMLAAFALNVGINFYVKARVERLINLI